MVRARVALASMLALAACGPSEPADGAEVSTSDAGDTTSTSIDTTGPPMPTTAGDGADTSSSGQDPAVTSEDTAAACANLPLGSPCEDSECDCESDQCFVLGGLGGVCSECDADDDCERGQSCAFGNPLTLDPAVCFGGEPPPPGACETTDDCPEGQYCATVIEVPGILSAATCSECEPETNAGCVGGTICTPTYDIANIGGYYACVEPGSVPNDEGCNPTGDGSECMSGQCAPAALMGIPVVTVCSPCNEDGDCGGGMLCQLPEVAIEGSSLALVPGACV